MEDGNPPAPPRRIGRYELRRELGRGMMGVVYEAHDPSLRRTIALKTIELAFAVSAEERQSFEQRFFVEARVAARLSHPGIVVVHDVGRDAESGLLFIASSTCRVARWPRSYGAAPPWSGARRCG